MKTAHMMLFPAIFLLFMISSCSTTPDRARTDLKKMNVAYDNTTFVTKSGEGDVETVQLFLAAGIDPNTEDKAGDTALVAAAKAGRKDVAEILLAGGAEIEKAVREGKTPLMWAAQYGQVEIVELLLERGAKADAKDDKSHTAMWWTKWNRRKDTREKTREMLRKATVAAEEGR